MVERSNYEKEEEHFLTVIDYKDGGFCSSPCMNEFMSKLMYKQRNDAYEVANA